MTISAKKVFILSLIHISGDGITAISIPSLGKKPSKIAIIPITSVAKRLPTPVALIIPTFSGYVVVGHPPTSVPTILPTASPNIPPFAPVSYTHLHYQNKLS